MSPDWASVGDYSGNSKPRAAWLAQVSGFGRLMPDLKWEVQQIVHQGKYFVARSRATGTPLGPFFGVTPAEGGPKRSFDIMTIDIHTVERGLIQRSFHVEDWMSAINQLKGQIAAASPPGGKVVGSVASGSSSLSPTSIVVCRSLFVVARRAHDSYCRDLVLLSKISCQSVSFAQEFSRQSCCRGVILC